MTCGTRSRIIPGVEIEPGFAPLLACRRGTTDVADNPPRLPRESGTHGLRRPPGPRAAGRGDRPDRPDPAQPPQAQPRRLLVPRLPRRPEEDDGPLWLRRPRRRPGPGRC